MTEPFGAVNDYTDDGRWLGRFPDKMRAYLAAEAEGLDTVAVLRDMFAELHREGQESMRELIRDSDATEAWVERHG